MTKSGNIHAVDWAECHWTMPDFWSHRKVRPDLRNVRIPKIVIYSKCGNQYTGVTLIDSRSDLPERNVCRKCAEA